MSTVKINALTRNIRNALIENIKRERPDLAEHFSENLSIVTSFPHYDYWIEEDLRALIFKF